MRNGNLRAIRRPCQLCAELHPLEQLVRCGYENDEGRSYGDGLVCFRCCFDLPDYLYVGGRVYPLVCHAP